MIPSFTEFLTRAFNILKPIFDNIEYWAPFVLGWLFFDIWVRYVRSKWISEIKWVILEIKLPKELHKTPLAMEVLLNALYQASSGTWFDGYFKGKAKNWSSLELVSIEGEVHFFIRVNKIFKDTVEAQIYAQYSTAEVYEVADYTKYVDFKGKEGEWSLWGTEFKLAKDDAYPIKTYVDFNLDKEGIKEEHKTDPITSTLEFIGSVGKNEQMWIQILIQPTGKRFKKPGTWFGKRDWKDEGKDLIEDIIKKARGRSGGGETSPVVLTKIEENTITAIQRSLSKLGFDCGIRCLYLFKGSAFNLSNIMSLLGVFRQYSSNELNSFKPSHVTSYDFPWQDFKDIRATKLKKKIFDAYKKRSYFYLPYKRKPFVLNTEELATIYHFPGGVAETPTFGRISSKKSEPPVNLPI